MEKDEIAMKLGEIAGTLQQVVQSQAVLMSKQDNFALQQSALLGRVSAAETTVHAHETRLASSETKISKLQQDNARNGAISGMVAGTGVTLLAEAIRQFLRIKTGGG